MPNIQEALQQWIDGLISTGEFLARFSQEVMLRELEVIQRAMQQEQQQSCK